MSVHTAAGGFVAACRCNFRRWFTTRAAAEVAGREHGYSCRWWGR